MAYPYLLILSCLLFRTLLLNCLCVCFYPVHCLYFFIVSGISLVPLLFKFFVYVFVYLVHCPYFFFNSFLLIPSIFQNFLTPAVILFPVSIFYSFPLSISIAFKIYFLCFCFSLLSLFLKVFSLFP